MRKKAPPTASAGGIQVFELTMDNSEGQDELNRRLRKPGESDPGPPQKMERPRKATTESNGKKRGRKKGKP